MKRNAGVLTLGFGAALTGVGTEDVADAAVVALNNFSPATFAYDNTGVGFQPLTISGGGYTINASFRNYLGQYIRGGPTGFVNINGTTAITTALSFATGTLRIGGFFGFQTSGGRLGWGEVLPDTSNPVPVTFTRAAINTNPGESVLVGTLTAVPLPGTLPLMALGALALGAAARRRMS